MTETRSALLWYPSANPADRKRIQPESLLHHCRNIYSQRGDDGIAAEIFRRLNISTGFFVEFGGWDGIHLSNCRALFEAGWSGAFIEADRNKFEELEKNYRGFERIICINQWVGLPDAKGKTIDQIAAENFPNRSIDYMSIDIDGIDYRILETTGLRPKVICIEGGFGFHPLLTRRVPDEIARKNLSQPLSVMIDVGRAAGYTPVCFNQNVFLVLNELAGPFDKIVKQPLTLWRDAWFNESDQFRAGMRRFRAGNGYVRAEEGNGLFYLPWERPSALRRIWRWLRGRIGKKA